MFNQPIIDSIDNMYATGWLPQRNKFGLFYKDTSSRSNLAHFKLNHENKSVIKKTDKYYYESINLIDYRLQAETLKTINSWIKENNWYFPASSVKEIFSGKLFNTGYIWYNSEFEVISYQISYFSKSFSHAAYIFTSPFYLKSHINIRSLLQVVIDSHQKKLQYTYLGTFSNIKNLYKHSMPGFEVYYKNKWIDYNTYKLLIL